VVLQSICRQVQQLVSVCSQTQKWLLAEMIQNEGHNHGVDWWAFAVLIFEMLCGHPPFRGDSTDATYKLILAGKFDCPKHLEPGSVDIVTKLLVKQDKRAGWVHSVDLSPALQYIASYTACCTWAAAVGMHVVVFECALRLQEGRS